MSWKISSTFEVLFIVCTEHKAKLTAALINMSQIYSQNELQVRKLLLLKRPLKYTAKFNVS
jgi:hypothetical protein